MARMRVIALTLLALAVPTFAFGGEDGSSEPQALSVSASLGGCGLANAAIVCQIDASWNSLEGADYYTVSVTRPDGSVLDLGQGGGSGRTLFVPYVGSGKYSVQVAAWGTPPGEDDPEVLARDRAFSSEESGRERSAKSSSPDAAAGESRSLEQADENAVDADREEDTASNPAGPESPACEELKEPEPDEGDADEPDADEPDPDEDVEVERELDRVDEVGAHDAAKRPARLSVAPAIRSGGCRRPPPKRSPHPHVSS